MTTNAAKPQVSVVLGSYNRKRLLKFCIQSICENGIEVPHEIIVVDGGSSDGALEWLIKQNDIITIVQHNRTRVGNSRLMKRSWGYFMNLGFKASQGKYICMVSDDSILIPGAIMEGYRCMEAGPEDVAACAFAFRDYPSEQEYKVGYTLGGKLFVNHGMYRRSALEAVGWIEEDLYRFYHADGDLCLKMWEKGYKVLPCEAAKLEHIIDPRGALRRSNYQAAAQNNDWEHYIKRWDGLFYFLNAPVTGGWIRVASVTDSCYAKRLAHRMPLSFKLAYGVQRYGRQLMSLAHKIFFKK